MKIISKSFKNVLSTEWVYFFISFIFTITIFFFEIFLFFNKSEFEATHGLISSLPNHDQAVVSNLGITGVTRQSYLFIESFLFVCLTMFFLFWAYSSYLIHRRNIILLRIKGISPIKAQGSFFLNRLILMLFIMLLTIPIFNLEIMIVNSILKTTYELFSFSPKIFLIAFVIVALFVLTNLPFSILPFREKKIISYLREKQ